MNFDVIVETIRAFVTAIIVLYLWRAGRRDRLQQQKGWCLIVGGFLLILFASLLDITDNFSSLNPYILIGDTRTEAFLEKIAGYLGGFIVVFIGFTQWVPLIAKLRNAEAQLRNKAAELESKVLSRTAELLQKNEELEQEKTRLVGAEVQIHKLNEALEAKVAERTKQLLAAQEELVRREKLAVLGQIAGSVGHELRNPLGVMSNAVYFLQTVLTDADDTTREYLNIIKDEIAGSERIVSDLLDSVRTKPPNPEIVGVDELINRTLRKCSVPASVSVKLDLPATLPPLRVDAMQIQQVLRNLISNGVEAMPDGGTLQIAAIENAQDQTITVSVTDTGIGMTPEQLSHLFQPLFTTKARGIGLGLVVVKNLTQANGGSIAVQSMQDRGTTFTVTLPADDGSKNEHA